MATLIDPSGWQVVRKGEASFEDSTTPQSVAPGTGKGAVAEASARDGVLRPERSERPDWLRVKVGTNPAIAQTRNVVRELGLHTVCDEAACPNLHECWSSRHATFLIMGDICTRACAFCNVATGRPNPLSDDEPQRIAGAVARLGLRHTVITSVDRDDLADGGAGHFARVIRAIRQSFRHGLEVGGKGGKGGNGTGEAKGCDEGLECPTIEILTPDFRNKEGALETVLAGAPDVFNHNLETVPGLYQTIRPGARYYHSLRLLQQAKEITPGIFTKSGLMVGLGETNDQLLQVMDDLRSADVDFLTIGQYLRPSNKHAPVKRFVAPSEFSKLKSMAQSKGFLLVAASPFTRSSYHADEDFKRLRAVRLSSQSAFARN